MKVKEYFNQKIAPFLKKRLVIPLIYFIVGLAYTRDLTDCLSRIILANAILISILLVRPKSLLSFDAVLTMLFLLWVAKMDHIGHRTVLRKCQNKLQNPFFEMSVWSFELFIEVFTFYMVLFGIAVFVQGAKEVLLYSDFSEDEERNSRAISSGLTQEELNKLEVDAYTNMSHRMEAIASNYQMVCSICLSEFQSNERVVPITGCRHTFHENCIKKWLKSTPACPYCRKNVRELDASHSSVRPSSEQTVQNAVSSIPFRGLRSKYCRRPNLRAYL